MFTTHLRKNFCFVEVPKEQSIFFWIVSSKLRKLDLLNYGPNSFELFKDLENFYLPFTVPTLSDKKSRYVEDIEAFLRLQYELFECSTKNNKDTFETSKKIFLEKLEQNQETKFCQDFLKFKNFLTTLSVVPHQKSYFTDFGFNLGDELETAITAWNKGSITEQIKVFKENSYGKLYLWLEPTEAYYKKFFDLEKINLIALLLYRNIIVKTRLSSFFNKKSFELFLELENLVNFFEETKFSMLTPTSNKWTSTEERILLSKILESTVAKI